MLGHCLRRLPSDHGAAGGSVNTSGFCLGCGFFLHSVNIKRARGRSGVSKHFVLTPLLQGLGKRSNFFSCARLNTMMHRILLIGVTVRVSITCKYLTFRASCVGYSIGALLFFCAAFFNFSHGTRLSPSESLVAVLFQCMGGCGEQARQRGCSLRYTRCCFQHG